MSGARRSLRAILAGVLGLSMAVALSAWGADQDSARTFSFTYEAEVPAQPAGTGPIDVFIPLAATDAHQTILRRDVRASIPGREAIESRYGNTSGMGTWTVRTASPSRLRWTTSFSAGCLSNSDWPHPP